MEHKETAAVTDRKQSAGKTIIQFIKFNLVGVMNTLVDFIVFQILNLAFGFTYLAQVIGYGCGIVNSYLWNSNWTFKEQKTHSKKEMLLFLAVNLVSLGVSLGVIWLCKNCFGVTDVWVQSWMPEVLQKFVNANTVAKLIATVCAIVVNYIGNRLFVFRAPEQEPSTQEET